MYDLDDTNRISRQNLMDVVRMLVDLGVPQTEKQKQEQEEVCKAWWRRMTIKCSYA